MNAEHSSHFPRFEETKRIARILRIVQLIATQPRRWTRAALAQEFEVSTRQIDKDLQVIRHGLHYALQHSREGYYFERGPLLKPVQLELPQALALALAAQQARDTGSVDAAVIAGALARLEEALPPTVIPYLRRAAAGGTVAFGPVRARGPVLATLEQALGEGRKVRISYRSASREDAVSERTIAPYYLLPYQRSWLVVAHDSLRDEVRMFKVDRIEQCRLTDEHYQVPADFDLEGYLGPAWGVLRGVVGPVEELVLHFSAEAGRWVRDERWHYSQEMERRADGSVVLRFRCIVTPELVRWVLSFGGRVRVEQPVHLRQAVAEEAKAALESCTKVEGQNAKS
jgi:predicted DNA-binding transcriptional regulator YafY